MRRRAHLLVLAAISLAIPATVVAAPAAEPLSLADRLGDFFSSIVEYFR